MKKMKKILIIDSHDDTRFSIRDALDVDRNRYEFLEAKSHKEYRSIVLIDKPDMILLEPSITRGWDIAAELKTNDRTKDIPIVFLTTQSNAISRQLALMNADDYIEKPFEIKKLNSAVKRSMSRFRF